MSKYRITVEGKTYEMGQHGFARDMEFTEVSSSMEKCCYELSRCTKSKRILRSDSKHM